MPAGNLPLIGSVVHWKRQSLEFKRINSCLLIHHPGRDKTADGDFITQLFCHRGLCFFLQRVTSRVFFHEPLFEQAVP